MTEKTKKEDSLTTQSAWILFAKIIGFALSTLLPILTVRYLTQDSVGVYRQVFLVVSNVSTILPLGFSMSAFYYLNRDPEKHSSAIFNIMMFNFMMGGLAFLTLFFYPQLLGNLFRNEDITLLAPLVGVMIWLWIFSKFLEIVPLAIREVRLATIIIILAQVTKLIFMVGAVILFATVEAFIYAAIAQAVLQAIVLFIYLNRRFPLFWKSFDWGFFREQAFYALPFGLAGLLYTAQTDIHNYFVSYRFSPAEFAIYTQGCFDLPLTAMVYESMSAIVVPRMSELQEQGKKREMLLLSVQATEKLAFVAYFPMFFFFMIAAGEFITTLFTKDYAASVPIFRINILMLPLYTLVVDPIGRAYSEYGRFLLKIRSILFIGMIFALWFGINNFDLWGMIAIVVVSSVIEKVASVWKALRIMEVTRKDIYLLKNVGKTAVVAALAAAVLLALYLPAKDILLELCLNFSHRILVLINFEKATDFVGGVLFLGICFFIYCLIYLFLANRFGVIAGEDKERFVGALLKLLRRNSSKIKTQELNNVETMPAAKS